MPAAGCPVCRAVVLAPARRCFVECLCPVCLTSSSTGYVLPCGHAVCGDDLAALGLAAEKPAQQQRQRQWRLPHSLLGTAQLALKHFILAGMAWLALTDPGAPFEFLHRWTRVLNGGTSELCAAPCYGTREIDHSCMSDCDCDGARHCSFFGFCAGDAGDCGTAAEPEGGAWPPFAFEASAPVLGERYAPTFTAASLAPLPRPTRAAAALASTLSFFLQSAGLDADENAQPPRRGVWSGALLRNSSLGAPFLLAGVGRFVLRLYPAGSADAPRGRCSAELLGPRGVAVAFVLRVGDAVTETGHTRRWDAELGRNEPLRCRDAGAGCWVHDAGEAAAVAVPPGWSVEHFRHDGPSFHPPLVSLSVLWASSSDDQRTETGTRLAVSR